MWGSLFLRINWPPVCEDKGTEVGTENFIQPGINSFPGTSFRVRGDIKDGDRSWGITYEIGWRMLLNYHVGSEGRAFAKNCVKDH